jgi:hypothetical protein
MKAMIDYGKTATWVGRINGFVVSNIRGESATQRNAAAAARVGQCWDDEGACPVPYLTGEAKYE